LPWRQAYDLPNQLGRRARISRTFSHYYRATRILNQDVVVIGGKNSAAEAGLDLYRNGARVTAGTSEQGAWCNDQVFGCGRTLKPDQGRPSEALFETRVKRINEGRVVVENEPVRRDCQATTRVRVDRYHPDFTFIESLGVRLDPESRKPALDPNTLESNVAESIWREWLSAAPYWRDFHRKRTLPWSRSFKHWRCER